jgi:D-galactarolactone cycloisomerase
MKIREIRAVGLRGATPEGGWSNEIQPDDCVHTLIAVLTDEGVTGFGSIYTSDHLVRGAAARSRIRSVALTWPCGIFSAK